MSLRVCGIQLRTQWGCLRENLETAALQIRKAAHLGNFDLFCLPELSSSGYPSGDGSYEPEVVDAVAEDEIGRSRHFFAALASEVDAYIAFGAVIRAAGRPRLSHVVVSPGGEAVARYDKIHLGGRNSAAGEFATFSCGDSVSTFNCRSFRVGLAICFDLRFPLHWRQMSGCDLVLHPCCFERDDTFASWHSFVETRAIENGYYVLSINHAGENYGASIAMPPWHGYLGGSELLAPTVLGTEAANLELTVERRMIEAVREKHPYHLYGAHNPGA